MGASVAPQYAAELVDAVAAKEGCLLIADAGATPVGFVAAYRDARTLTPHWKILPARMAMCVTSSCCPTGGAWG
jgi:hypothetical protein